MVKVKVPEKFKGKKGENQRFREDFVEVIEKIMVPREIGLKRFLEARAPSIISRVSVNSP